MGYGQLRWSLGSATSLRVLVYFVQDPIAVHQEWGAAFIQTQAEHAEVGWRLRPRSQGEGRHSPSQGVPIPCKKQTPCGVPLGPWELMPID